MIELEEEMIYRVRTIEPGGPTEGSPLGTRQTWQVDWAELSGPRIRASLASKGIDWMSMSPDGYWRPDVRAQFVTDDGAFILMHYTGLVQQTDAFKTAATNDRETAWDDQYMRLSIRFDTGARAYGWLNTSLFVARGRLLGTGRIEYAVYRVT
jgi:hypothetical protein